MKAFRVKLAELRDRAGLSDEALAEALGVSRGTTRRWRVGEGEPDRVELLALAGFFGVSVEFLARDDLDRDGEVIRLSGDQRYLLDTADRLGMEKAIGRLLADEPAPPGRAIPSRAVPPGPEAKGSKTAG